MAQQKKEIGQLSSIEKFILHVHPKRIDKKSIQFTRTFGLGGMSALLFILLTISGIILRFSYIPTVEHAYDSIIGIQEQTILGQFVRNLHHLSAKFLIVISFLHLLRVYYSQSIYKQRSENWIYGLLLFFTIIASSFTGYLLPWDQLSYWAVTVITKIIEYIPFIGMPIANMLRGSETIDGNTLLNFYTLHTGILPMLFLILALMHFWLVRKAGGVAMPKMENVKKVDVVPNLIWKEIAVASSLIAVLFLLSVFYKAPLLDQANPLQSPNPSKAPWYFLGAQELLLHLHPFFSVVIVPLFTGIFLLGLPYYKYKNLNEGVWFNSKLGKTVSIWSFAFAFLFTFAIIYLFDHVLHYSLWFASWPSILTTGLLPLLSYCIPIVICLLFWKFKYKANKTELIMAMASIIIASYASMLLIALVLRGKDMMMIF